VGRSEGATRRRTAKRSGLPVRAPAKILILADLKAHQVNRDIHFELRRPGSQMSVERRFQTLAVFFKCQRLKDDYDAKLSEL
jgi:hypothetical protein